MTDQPLWQLSAVELAAKIRRGDISAVDAVASSIERLEECNSQVNAVTVSLAEAAMKQAEAADRQSESGTGLGVLHGVPVTVKENIDQRGLANTNGLPALEHNIATDDSPIVRNLRQAGAVIIGRTNTPEFSYRWFTDNPLRGKTLNPWNADLTPGGSSGGAASSVALGIGAIAHGNDLGGSLRYPAYACGVSTIKPGLGRVAAYNPTSAEERPPVLQMMSVQGPIAREVRDVRLALEVMAQPDYRDPWWVPAPLHGPQESGRIKVALTYGPQHSGCDPAVVSALDQAADHLAGCGYRVEKVDPPALAEGADMWRKLIGADTHQLMLSTMRKLGSEQIVQVAEVFSGFDIPADLKGYMELTAERTRIWREWAEFMEQYPIVLAPVSQRPPFTQGADENGPEAIRQLVLDQEMLYLVNLLGLPSASVPTGISNDTPMGVQLIGRRFREDQCLDAAQAIEDRTGVLVRGLWGTPSRHYSRD
ncbi:hypothetical protein AB833_18860 [Chromatiales bacterium (ex Bugula neritina AB1)]|nr:hypothetical protein AB833_18860 [Chromatiales bacterium (ex Bugula neritina AB1)]